MMMGLLTWAAKRLSVGCTEGAGDGQMQQAPPAEKPTGPCAVDNHRQTDSEQVGIGKKKDEKSQSGAQKSALLSNSENRLLFNFSGYEGDHRSQPTHLEHSYAHRSPDMINRPKSDICKSRGQHSLKLGSKEIYSTRMSQAGLEAFQNAHFNYTTSSSEL
jgi:hypothetical protein